MENLELETNTNEEVDTSVENTNTEPATQGETLYANKYKSVDAMLDGIENLKEHIDMALPDRDVLSKFDTKTLENIYATANKNFSSRKPEETTNEDESGEIKKLDEVKEESTTEDNNEIKKLTEDEPKDYTKILMENINADNLNELLEGSGFTEDFINTFKAGQKAINKQIQTDIYADIGGSESYNKLVDWASSELSKSEKEAFNKVLDSGDKDMIKFNINNLYKRFEASKSFEP